MFGRPFLFNRQHHAVIRIHARVRSLVILHDTAFIVSKCSLEITIVGLYLVILLWLEIVYCFRILIYKTNCRGFHPAYCHEFAAPDGNHSCYIHSVQPVGIRSYYISIDRPYVYGIRMYVCHSEERFQNLIVRQRVFYEPECLFIMQPKHFLNLMIYAVSLGIGIRPYDDTVILIHVVTYFTEGFLFIFVFYRFRFPFDRNHGIIHRIP